MNSCLLFILVCVGLGFTTAPRAEAAVLKCKAPDGTITYTQTTCPPGTTNTDFPEDWNPNIGATKGGGTSREPSSPRAVLYKNAFVECAMSESRESCGMIDDLASFCAPEANWPSESCTALREGAQAARDTISMSDGDSKDRLRALCARGGELACSLMECPLNTLTRGSDDQARACAARAKMPLSATWIQFETKRSGLSSSTTTFVCMKRVEQTNSIGERLAFRESITVIAIVPRQGVATEFTASSLPGDVFANLNTAATAGCEAKTSRPAPQKPKPRSDPKKDPQSI